MLALDLNFDERCFRTSSSSGSSFLLFGHCYSLGSRYKWFLGLRIGKPLETLRSSPRSLLPSKPSLGYPSLSKAAADMLPRDRENGGEVIMVALDKEHTEQQPQQSKGLSYDMPKYRCSYAASRSFSLIPPSARAPPRTNKAKRHTYFGTTTGCGSICKKGMQITIRA
ncbi:hypothetical protein BT96DRAFT_264044 [Gymnopus androsaceus JB14]|uniref:Uncharacterized protein n=1 Tax=Gymnopus androsaceus JB14 TaxID=1447944 RepID=A0A6A4H4F4_9AGAR|nr:hypothetical protein BT96DRAFT_264044 [Gymnopus androsaceus JB14]